MRIGGQNRLLAMSALTVIGILGLHLVEVRAASPKGVMKIAIHWNISNDWLDPATSIPLSGAYFPLYLIHDALLKPMPDGMYSPCLAESWSISPNAKVYEFKLRKGVKFHNGDTMTAEDVVFSFWRYKATQAKFIHDKTEKVEAVNPYLVWIYFKEPFPDFLENLLPGATTIGWVVPKKYTEQVGEAGFKKHVVGAGPYKFVEFVPGVKLVGEAFEEYWRKVPNIKRMEIYSSPELSTRYALLKRGEVDGATWMHDVFYNRVKEDPSLRLFNGKTSNIVVIHIGSQFDPKSPWSDVRVRKAASLAIDRKPMVDIWTPGSSPIGNLGLPGDVGVLDRAADPYDPERAKKLLAAAGYPKGFHGGTIYPYESGIWPTGEMIANYWKAIGITLDTVLLDRPAWLAKRRGGQMKGAIFNEILTIPTIGGRLAYLFGGDSYGNYPEIQTLWDQYNKSVEPQVRKDLMTRIQELIYHKTMYIYLYYIISPSGFGPRVRGNPIRVSAPVFFAAPFEDMELND